MVHQADWVEWAVGALLLLLVFVLSALARHYRAQKQAIEELIKRSVLQANLIEAAGSAIVREAGKIAAELRELSTELRKAGRHLAAVWKDKKRSESAVAALAAVFDRIDRFILVHSAVFAALGLERQYFEYSLHGTGLDAIAKPELAAPAR